MTIYWVNVDTQDALTLMAAVERALETGDTGAPPAPGVAGSPASPANPTDAYLHDNMAIARAVWSARPPPYCPVEPTGTGGGDQRLSAPGAQGDMVVHPAAVVADQRVSWRRRARARCTDREGTKAGHAGA
jgi:hypothetical protein